MRRALKGVLIAVTLGGALLIGALALLFWWTRTGVFAVDRFDRAAWSRPITDAQSVRCYRGGMAQDIQNRLLKRGMSKADVETMLGPPNDVGRTNEYRYALGMCSGFAMDHDDLHIFFNEHGMFEHSAVIRH